MDTESGQYAASGGFAAPSGLPDPLSRDVAPAPPGATADAPADAAAEAAAAAAAADAPADAAGQTKPAPQRKRRRGLVVGAIALAAVLIAGVVTGIVLAGTSSSDTPAGMARQAGRAIAAAAGVTLSGSYNMTPANLTVTRAGAVVGSYSPVIPYLQVTLLAITGASYVKAPDTFWQEEGVSSDAAQRANGRWARINGSGISSLASFTPAGLASGLENVRNHPDATYTTLGHARVVRIDTDGAFCYITTSTPHRLLQVSSDNYSIGPEYSFHIKPLTATTVGPVFTVLHRDAQALQGAQDPDASFSNSSAVHFGFDCDFGDTSCTTTESVTVTDPDSAKVLVTMTADYSPTKDGTPFGSCADKVSVNTSYSASGVHVSLGCRLTSQWTRWVDSQNGKSSYWVDWTVDAEVNTASDVAALQEALDRQQGGCEYVAAHCD